MQIITCDQGSADWFTARAGVITASMFGEVRRRVDGLTSQQQTYVSTILSGKSEADAREAAGYKSAPRAQSIEKALAGEKVGDFTAAAKDYAFRLAIERISGEALADENFQTYAMRRGNELEPEARSLHEFQCDLIVDPVGFVKTDDGKFGASADGFIGKDGGSEYKCFIDPSRIRDIVINRDISDCADQVQGGMWITGRTWWHFALYCRALAAVRKTLTVFEVKRDDDYINAMETELLEFDALVCEYEGQLRAQPESDERKAA